MGAIKRNIPNFITCLNLFSGCIGIVFAFYNKVPAAVLMMFIAASFDFLDGLFARLLKVTSPIGRDLDSLADIITFGFLPGVMMYKLLRTSMGDFLMGMPGFSYDHPYFLLCHLGFLITVFSAIRLARFNNDPSQSHLFKGLPTPANGLLIACLFYWIMNGGSGWPSARIEGSNYFNIGPPQVPKPVIMDFLTHPIVLIGIIFNLSFLLVAPIKLMAIKFKSFSWKENQWKYILLIVSAPLIIFLGFASAPIILILYIIISQIHFRINKHEI